MALPTAARSFPLGDLRLGVASAPTQIEGGDRANSWFDWASLPGRIADGTSPVVATDHWERWPQDTALLADLGIGIYRMGIEWARIEPRPGQFDEGAIEHYRQELSALRDAGITPLVTLHHFTNPSWFEAMGAWTHDLAVDIWLRFVRLAVSEFGDLVSEWTTINEPNVYATMGYLFGLFPPGRRNAFGDLRTVLRQMAIAHCKAYRIIHELQPGPDTKVGFAHHLRVFDPLNPRNPAHRALTATNRYLFQGVLTDAMLGGSFDKALGGQPADVDPGRYYDYIGINYYSRTAVSGIADGRFPASPVSDLDWEIYPQGLVRVAREVTQRHPGPVWVTENGTADAADAFRSRFIHDHLAAMVTSALPFERYYHWCFVDNWEWAEGETARFGLVALDNATQERTVRDSGRFFSGIIAAGGVTEELYAAHVEHQRYPVR